MCTEIDRISELTREDPRRQFFSIAHLKYQAQPLRRVYKR